MQNTKLNKDSLKKKKMGPGKPLPESAGTTFFFRNKFITCSFLFLVGFIYYFNTLQNGYVLDDSLFITGNNFTLKGFAGIKDIWTNDAFVGAHGRAFDLEGGRYRPIAISMFAVEYALFGLNPFYGHLVNVILYALTGVLLYLFLSLLFNKLNAWLPFLASIIFMIHPIHTEVVANIKSRDEILAVFFLLLSLWSLLKNSMTARIQCGLFFLLSLLSKENSITALAVAPLMLMFFRDNSLKKAMLSVVPLMAATIFYLLLRSKFAAGFGEKIATNVMDSPYFFASFAEKYATIIFVCGKYLSLLFFPFPLSYDYSFNAIPLRKFFDPGTIISMIAYLVIGVFTIRAIFNRLLIKETSFPFVGYIPVIAFGAFFYLSAFSIVSNLFFNIGAPMGERFLYLPSIGFSIALAGIICRLLKVKEEEAPALNSKILLSLALIIPASAYGTISRNKAWKDNYTLYATDIKTVPNSARAQLFIGIELLNSFYKSKDKTELSQSISAMESACKINPDFYHAFYNLGLAYQAADDHVKAVAAFERVLEIEPKHINSHYYLGMSYGKGFNRFDKAIEYIEKGLKYGYNGTDGYVNLGISYAMTGDYKNALAAFEKGISLSPANANLYLNMGITYDNLGEKDKAKSYYEKAFALDPALKR